MIQDSVSDGICTLRLDLPPLNILTPELLDALGASIRRAGRDASVRGIVIAGRDDHFSAGADVNLFRHVAGPDDAIGLSRVFQEAFQAIEDSSKPVAATVAGRVQGGALELAMACHVRVAAAGSRFSMPEVTLGLIPGAGGTQRLVRLVGLEAALKMLLTGETVDADRALSLGLVDAVCPSEMLLARAADLLRATPVPVKTSQRTERARDAAASEAAFDGAEDRLRAGRPELIAPRKIVDAVRAGLEESFEAGLLAEQRAFAECLQTPAARNKIYLFFATRGAGKLPELAGAKAAPVARAAVLGAGTMGTGIAQALISGGVGVVVLDEDESAPARAAERIRQSLQRRVAPGKLSQQQADDTLAMLAVAGRWEDLAGVDLVIESVFEDVEVKRSVFGRLEESTAPGTILATNTSTLSLDVLAEGMRSPERLIGMHFFNPAHYMPLVEIIRRDVTPPDVLATVVELARGLRKTPVVVRNREGFLVNRLFVPYLQEAFTLLEEGASPRAIDAAMVAFGFSMGPLVLIDMAGLDILVRAQEVLGRAVKHHGPLSGVALGLVEHGHLGQKTGAGVFRYEPGDRTPRDSRTTAETIARVQRRAVLEPRDVSPEEITERLVLRMVAEAFWVIEEGVARCESDLDAATVLGIGFPDFRGGVLRYARDLGLDTVFERLQGLTRQCGERFAPCRLLREMKGVS
jgi:3-hydroxyacyl-CoA dehydrogenase